MVGSASPYLGFQSVRCHVGLNRKVEYTFPRPSNWDVEIRTQENKELKIAMIC